MENLSVPSISLEVLDQVSSRRPPSVFQGILKLVFIWFISVYRTYLLRLILWKHSVQHREQRFRGCCWCAAWASAAAARTNSSDVKSLDSTNLRKALKTEVHCSVAQDSSHSEFVTAGTVKIIKTVVRFHEFFVRKYWNYKISIRNFVIVRSDIKEVYKSILRK